MDGLAVDPVHLQERVYGAVDLDRCIQQTLGRIASNHLAHGLQSDDFWKEKRGRTVIRDVLSTGFTGFGRDADKVIRACMGVDQGQNVRPNGRVQTQIILYDQSVLRAGIENMLPTCAVTEGAANLA